MGGETVTIVASADSKTVSALAIAPSVTQCPGRVEATNLAIRDDIFVGGAIATGTSTLPVYYAGYIGDAGAIAGGFAIGGNIPGTTCPGPAGVFTAIERAHQGVLGGSATPRATYAGTVETFTSAFGPRTVGTVNVMMGADGRTIDRFIVTATSSGCSYPLDFTNQPLIDNKTFRASVRPTISSSGPIEITGVVQGKRSLGGAIDYPESGTFPTSYCAAMLMRWSATIVEPAAFATAPLFNAAGQAFAVFTGGSAARLKDAGASVGATGIWVQDSGGIYGLLVVNGPAFLNAEFDARFPQGFSGPTAVFLTR